MTDADHLRMQQAAEKKRRKLAAYTNTPAARARRLEQEREHAAGLPMSPPINPCTEAELSLEETRGTLEAPCISP